jgi:hypothetical protein
MKYLGAIFCNFVGLNVVSWLSKLHGINKIGFRQGRCVRYLPYSVQIFYRIYDRISGKLL